MSSASQPKLVQFEFFRAPNGITQISVGYDHLQKVSSGAVGTVRVIGPDEAAFEVTDTWTIEGNCVLLAREIRVTGSSRDGAAP